MVKEQKNGLLAGKTAGRAVLSLALLCGAILAAHAVYPKTMTDQREDLIVDSPRPLWEVAQLLQSRYGVAVTLEEPFWPGKSGAQAAGGQAPESFYLPKAGIRFVIPADLLPEERSAFHLSTLNAILALYNREGSDAVKFEAVSSEWGFHILPVAFRMDNGEATVVHSPLDFPVHVANRRRMASEHFEALCKAVGASTGLEIRPFAPRMDGWFAMGGVVPPKFGASQLSEEDRESHEFAWGTENHTGRSALLHLLKLSSTTVSWALHCRGDSGRKGTCFLNLSALRVKELDEQGRLVLDENGKPRLKVQYFDRLNRIPLKRPPITIQ